MNALELNPSSFGMAVLSIDEARDVEGGTPKLIPVAIKYGPYAVRFARGVIYGATAAAAAKCAG